MAPVDYSASSAGRRTHQYAVDLFAPEGASVRAVSRGVVVLADRDWSRANLFSTTSRKGGNAVIVFDPDHDRFYRYCHMGTVLVSAGELVAAGQIVGNVGHSGLNASQAGHGRHLHFETNEYLQGHVRALDYRRLRTMLRQWRATSANVGALGTTRALSACPLPEVFESQDLFHRSDSYRHGGSEWRGGGRCDRCADGVVAGLQAASWGCGPRNFDGFAPLVGYGALVQRL